MNNEFFAVVKHGVYLQGVWFYESLALAEDSLVELVNSDDDDYHDWSIVSLKNSPDVTMGQVLYSLTKPTDNTYKKWDNRVVGGNRLRYPPLLKSDLFKHKTK